MPEEVATVRWDDQDHFVTLQGGRIESRPHDNGPDYHTHLSEVSQVALADLRPALAAADRDRLGKGALDRTYIAVARDDDSSSSEPPWVRASRSIASERNFWLDAQGDLLVSFEVLDPKTFDFDDVALLLESIFEAKDVELVKFYAFPNGDFGAFGHLTLELLLSGGGTVGSVWQLTEDIEQMLRSDAVSLESALGLYALIKLGYVEQLLGRRESSYFDAKSEGYGLAVDSGKFELCLDVAAFANSGHPGLIAIGLTTDKDGANQDVVRCVTGWRPGSFNVDAYRSVLRQGIFPPVHDVLVDVVPYEGKELLLLLVPRQDEALHPFLVKGSMDSRGKLNKTSFTIPFRHDDTKQYMSIEAVHEMLSLGFSLRSANRRVD
ncbi:hypothetical protein FHX82_004384 [Amycolatopsis bartoniae]|uniref:Uncharacterized protein n=1 Tax=Amycolatopsis bartoniae TaxID=941986 RepID=A0A8H9IYL0_9PSEU|nr:hypothetical protein [Amycolatopsis bartoniae]MBB2937311.1 hypothetical protein [Amycolatopsis bartoniae]TVT07949.1 hypothetical protein FNH07_14490 [Amycolatopsis bartoniae]GHF78068.1 hypothetical protein GCM10017566_60430 [Amycolatopsis bartoniae]